MSELRKPFVYVFKTAKGCYLYDVNTNVLCSVSNESYEILQKGEQYNCELQELKDAGLLKTKRVNILQNPISCYVECILNERINYILLQLTQQCNLRCEYCLYSGSYNNMRLHSSKNMNVAMLEKILDFAIDRSVQSYDFHIGFYGGEPLIRFDLIKWVFNYMETKCPGRPVLYSMTTNATLLTPEIAAELVKHKVKLQISLDGPEEIHNANRKFANGTGTFNRIIKNLQRLFEEHPDYYKNNVAFNAVLDGSATSTEIFGFFSNHDLLKNNRIKLSRVNTTFENSFDKHLDKKDDYDLSFSKNAVLYYYNSLKYPETEPDKILDSQYSFADIEAALGKRFFELPEKSIHCGLCVPGVSRLFVTVHGDFYICEKVGENRKSIYCIGNVIDGFNYQNIEKLLNLGNTADKACSNCWAFRLCNLCAAKVDFSADNYEVKLQKRCNAFRRMIANQIRDYCVFCEIKGELIDGRRG